MKLIPFAPSTSFIYTLKWIGLTALGCFLYIMGYRTGHTPVLVVPARTYEVVVEKEVIKETIVEKVIEKQVIKWRKSKTTKPDGTVKETTEWTGTESKEQSSQKETITSSETLSVKEKIEVSQHSRPDWGLAAGRSLNQVNRLGVSRRVAGDLWLEVDVNTTKDIGMSIRYHY